MFEGQSQRVCYALDMNGDNIQKTVSDLIDEWTSIAYLFGAVHRFADSYNSRSNFIFDSYTLLTNTV